MVSYEYIRQPRVTALSLEERNAAELAMAERLRSDGGATLMDVVSAAIRAVDGEIDVREAARIAAFNHLGDGWLQKRRRAGEVAFKRIRGTCVWRETKVDRQA